MDRYTILVVPGRVGGVIFMVEVGLYSIRLAKGERAAGALKHA